MDNEPSEITQSGGNMPSEDRTPQTNGTEAAHADVFSGIAAEIASLAENEKHLLVWHDMSALVTPLRFAFDDTAFDQYDAATNTQLKLGHARRIFRIASRIPPVSAGEQARMALRRIPVIQQMMPTLEHSIAFLENPTRENFEALQALRDKLGPVLHMYIPQATQDTYPFWNREISGDKTIDVLNIVKNAVNYGIEDTIKVAMEDDTLVVTNESTEPVPDDALNFGERTRGPGSHFGLYLTNIYTRITGNKLSYSSSKIPTSDNYFVRFALSLS